VLSRLRRAVPFDAVFWALVDPSTLLFTQPHQRDIPPETIPYFIENEFLGDDVNKWTTLARDRVGVRTLVEVTNASSKRARATGTSSNRSGSATSSGRCSGPAERAGATSASTAKPAARSRSTKPAKFAATYPER